MTSVKRLSTTKIAKVPKEFKTFVCNDVKIITFLDKESIYNGYINATKLFNPGKRIAYWNIQQSTKDIIQNIIKKCPDLDGHLTFVSKGGCKKRSWNGTYIHPFMIRYFMEWSKPHLSDEWIDTTIHELNVCIAKYEKEQMNSEVLFKQRRIDIIQRLFDVVYASRGQCNVKCGPGCIDILAHNAIVSVKRYDLLPRFLEYMVFFSRSYPEKDKVVYVFDVPDHSDMIPIIEKYASHNVNILVYGH